MPIKEIKKGIWAIMINDWDRRIFDELIPLPEGTSYNAYFLKDDKNVLIDTADPRKKEELFEALEKINVKKIDYIVSNHSEQDHSGCLPTIIEKFPEAKIITSEKGKEFLSSLLLIPENNFIVMKDCEKLSIGEKKLEFISAPYVHWPETILTYEEKNKVLFPCDLFGSHLATSEIYASNNINVLTSAKRYYAEIMMPFRTFIKGHIKKLENYEISLIAPSHGPIYNNPSLIINAYNDWVSDNVKNEVIVIYVSMHGSVKKMIDYFVDRLIEKSIVVKPFNLTETDIGQLAISIVDAATVVIGSPTVLTGPHPVVLYASYLFKILKPKTKFLSIIGSFGWGTNMIKLLSEMIPSKDIDVLEPVMIKGYPKENDFALIDKLAEEIYKKHKEIKII
ncbi:MAG TPA: FprA family A-type flavoprotein [bacterium]|nr:FprA family A-type flavoprotein [bacterium]